jgi:hypothetical protein
VIAATPMMISTLNATPLGAIGALLAIELGASTRPRS